MPSNIISVSSAAGCRTHYGAKDDHRTPVKLSLNITEKYDSYVIYNAGHRKDVAPSDPLFASRFLWHGSIFTMRAGAGPSATCVSVQPLEFENVFAGDGDGTSGVQKRSRSGMSSEGGEASTAPPKIVKKKRRNHDASTPPRMESQQKGTPRVAVMYVGECNLPCKSKILP